MKLQESDYDSARINGTAAAAQEEIGETDVPVEFDEDAFIAKFGDGNEPPDDQLMAEINTILSVSRQRPILLNLTGNVFATDILTEVIYWAGRGQSFNCARQRFAREFKIGQHDLKRAVAILRSKDLIDDINWNPKERTSYSLNARELWRKLRVTNLSQTVTRNGQSGSTPNKKTPKSGSTPNHIASPDASKKEEEVLAHPPEAGSLPSSCANASEEPTGVEDSQEGRRENLPSEGKAEPPQVALAPSTVPNFRRAAAERQRKHRAEVKAAKPAKRKHQPMPSVEEILPAFEAGGFIRDDAETARDIWISIGVRSYDWSAEVRIALRRLGRKREKTDLKQDSKREWRTVEKSRHYWRGTDDDDAYEAKYGINPQYDAYSQLPGDEYRKRLASISPALLAKAADYFNGRSEGPACLKWRKPDVPCI
jgi:hypothetical protein